MRGFAPSFKPRRLISVRPLVIRAALVFRPKPNPSIIPEAMAITFLTEPPNSTPIISLFVYTLKRGVAKTCCTKEAVFLSFDATATRVGTFEATSRAKLGPERAAICFSGIFGSVSLSTPDMVKYVLFSIPFEAETMMVSFETYPAISCDVSLIK